MEQFRSNPAAVVSRAVVVFALASASTLAAEPFADTIKPFLLKNCATCHFDRSPAAGFDVGELLKTTNLAAERERWEQVAGKLRTGEMPPKGTPRPNEATVKTVVEWIDTTFDRIDRAQPIRPGHVTARRLNRFEFANSVRDLLGIDMLPGDDLPADPYGYGFDNIGDVLNMNAGLTERYLKAAERISEAAIPSDAEPIRPVTHRYLAERIGQDRQLHVRLDHAFPADGDYVLRTGFYQALKDGTQVRIRLLVDGSEQGSRLLKFYYQIDRAAETPPVHVTAGRHRIEAMIEVLPEPVYKGAPPYVEYLQVHGPKNLTPAGQSSAYTRFFRCGHAPGQHQPSCARKILAPLARTAWRRPPSPTELDGLFTLVSHQQQQTGSFELGMRAGLQAILISPHFLFRIERDRGPGPQPLSQHELATRLSYFLWSGLPDAELSHAADTGTLTATLRQQAARMLAGPKSAAFVESFAGQWLQLRNLVVVKPDAQRFPTFTGELASDMRTETEMFFAAMLKEDRPIPEFLDAKFTFLNERLAKHYGIAGVTGDEFRRVDLDGAQRGGVLSQASILTVSSYPTRTSPVIRGKWVLENILDQPPPPPPPNVPTLDEKSAVNAGSMRQQLEKHRANAVCAGCHARMDPLGFGLENYDAIGRWRDHEGSAPIDVSGILPNGSRFSSPAELKSILVGDRDVFTEALARKMLTYAAGRGMETSDRPAVRKLAAHVRDSGYRMTELILGVVESEPFRMRESPAETKQ